MGKRHDAEEQERENGLPTGFGLEPEEHTLGCWTCGIPKSPSSGVVKEEGHLILTDRAVLYEPMHAPRLFGGGPSPVLGGSRRRYELGLIRSVDSVDGRLPRLRLDIERQEPFVVILSGSRFSVPWSKRKWLALEDALERIRSAIHPAP